MSLLFIGAVIVGLVLVVVGLGYVAARLGVDGDD